MKKIGVLLIALVPLLWSEQGYQYFAPGESLGLLGTYTFPLNIGGASLCLKDSLAYIECYQAIRDTPFPTNRYAVGLLVLNILNPIKMESLNYLPLADSFNFGGAVEDVQGDIEIKDTIAYLAAMKCGLKVINISNSKKPEFITSFASTQGGIGVIRLNIIDTLVFLADGDSGLWIVNIRNPFQPKTISRYFESNENKWCSDVITELPFSYIRTYHLTLLNVTDPSNPYMVSQVEDPNIGNWLTKKEHYLYTSEKIVDIAETLDPRMAGGFPLRPPVHSIFLSENYIYMASTWFYDFPPEDSVFGLTVFNIKDPIHPTVAIDYRSEPLRMARVVYVRNDTVYVLTGEYTSKLLVYHHIPAGIAESSGRIVNGGFMQAFPNPFRWSSYIRFQLPERTQVSLRIYDVTGRLVKRFLNSGTSLEAGVHTVRWDGKDDIGVALPTGIYFIQLRTKHNSITQKVITLK